MKTVTRITVMAWMALASVTWAGSPPASITMVAPYINYQGRLVTTSNTPYADALHTIDLALYPQGSNTKLWNERYYVQTRDGYFSVNLGSGTPLLSSNNVAIYQVLWKTNAADPDIFLMGLTMLTDQSGKTNASPVEATPRQQFQSAPFAFRALQSTYASKSDGVFDASPGITTTKLSSSNNVIQMDAVLKNSRSIWVSGVRASESLAMLSLLSDKGPLYLGYWPAAGGGAADYASDIFMGASVDAAHGVLGTDIHIDAKTLDFGTTSITVTDQPMFVRIDVDVTASTTSVTTSIPSGIDLGLYEVLCVGYYTFNTPSVRAVLVYPRSANGTITFTSIPSGGSVKMCFLGIRKGLIRDL